MYPPSFCFCLSTHFLFTCRHSRFRFRASLTPHTVSRVLRIPLPPTSPAPHPQTLPFVLLGLSVDCMFLLTKGYDALVQTDTSGSLESRFRDLLASTGSNVFITLFASAVAFALGALTELPSITWFSVYAALGVTCIIIATVGVWSACPAACGNRRRATALTSVRTPQRLHLNFVRTYTTLKVL